MKQRIPLLLFCTILFSIGSTFAQFSEDKYLEAEDFVEDGNFHKALDLYQELLKLSPNNANLNFKIGYCYLNTATQKTKAIPYLEFASKHISDDYDTEDYKELNVPIEALYYLGKAYHVNYRFDDAERTFFDLKKQLPISEEEFLATIDHELEWCQYARLLMKTPVEMTVSNLGQNVNSAFTEHSPVISGDESVIVFTSKREGNTGQLKTDDGQYFEDVYISYSDGKQFGKAQKISGNINTNGHEASIGLSFDGSTLFIYRDDEGNGNIYVSEKGTSGWSVAEPLPAVINSKYRETHASMSFDKNEIYFTSDRKGGFGGLDIYRVRKLPNGRWSRAQNLGPDINTPYDEEGPYLHPDGTSLFFASLGHNSMGGFDIFVSYNNEEEDKWMKPENIGYPINTPDDDVYYVPSVDGRRAYYASYANNSLGHYDIFRIDLSESHVRNQTVIAGIAAVKSGEYLQDGIVSISTMDDELVGIYTPDQEKKRFLAILPRGKTYKVLFESTNYESFEKIIRVPEFAYDQSGKVVQFNDVIIGGDEPLEQGVIAMQGNNNEDSVGNNLPEIVDEESKYSFIGGNKELAQADTESESYESSMEFDDGGVAEEDWDNDGLSNTKANSDEMAEASEQQKEDGALLDHSIAVSKKKSQKNKGIGFKNNEKSSFIYYLLGIIGVVVFGYVLFKRKTK